MSHIEITQYLSSIREVFLNQWGENFQRSAIVNFMRNGRLSFPDELTQPLEVLIKESSLFQPGMKLRLTSSSGPIQASQLANTMLERVALGACPAAIVDNWLEFISTPNWKITRVTALRGIRLERAVQLAANIEIAPARDVPGTTMRERAFGLDRWGELSLIQPEMLLNPSSAALLIRTDADVLSSQPFAFDDIINFEKEISQMISVAIDAITISGNSAPSLWWSYDIVEHDALGYSQLGFAGGSWPASSVSFQDREVDGPSIIKTYNLLQQLPLAMLKSIHLSISRLRRSRSHSNNADRAIDLGIAIESALLHGEKGVGAKGEIRNKVGTRAAWLIGRTPTEREEVFKALSRAYDARSAAVHSGAIGAGQHEHLPQADEYCRRVLVEIAKRGAYPNWTRTVLGFDAVN